MFNPFKKKADDMADIDALATGITKDELKDIDNMMAGIDNPTPEGTLAPGEPHPASSSAMKYIVDFMSDMQEVAHLDEVLKKLAPTNRLAEICNETFLRVMNNEKVDDRYVLGLAWTIRNLMDAKIERDKQPSKPDKPTPVSETSIGDVMTAIAVDTTTHPDGK